MQVRNHVTLIGNLGQDPVSKVLPNGTPLVEFSLATNDSYRNSSGDRVTRTEWHRVKAFGKTAETLATYLTKGSKIAVAGTIRYGKWKDKHGQNRTSTDILVENFTFLGGKGETTDSATAEAATMVAAEPAPSRGGRTNKRRRPAAADSKNLPF